MKFSALPGKFQIFTLFGIIDCYRSGSHTKIIQFRKIRCEDHRPDIVELTMVNEEIGNQALGNEVISKVCKIVGSQY